MEEEFLAENNACGQTLLHLVSRGNAIIAELLRLKDHIPQIFRLETKQDVQKYGDILLDFTYFSNSEACDKKIEKTESLLKVDKEIRDTYAELLNRFYLAYESIYKYVTDLNTFIEELEEGGYIQQNLDTVFLSPDGTQLMCESVYVYGVMLLILDIYHLGPIRERIVVTHSRYSITVGRLDHVCRLIRSTGLATNKRPVNYPVDYFRRIEVNPKLVELTVGKLRTEDVYHQQKSLPLPEHSTTALAPQAALLFVVLFFSPNVLIKQMARMREIVDKFFPDNWIVNIYMGITVNLIEMWEPFKAAKTALTTILDPSNVKEYATLHSKNLERLLDTTDDMLKEGTVTKVSVLDKSNQMLAFVRECNVTLRWLLLHSSKHLAMGESLKKCKTVRDQVIADTEYSQDKTLKLLLNTARVENNIIEIFKTILNERSVKWEDSKKDAVLRLEELSDVFSGVKPLMRVNKSENLRKWFLEIKENVGGLSVDEPNISARKIVQLVQALEEVQGYPQMMSNLQVKQLLVETCTLLRTMLSAVSVRDSVLVQMQVIGDFSYGWLLVDDFTNLLQEWITKDPALVQKIRALLHKLSAAMETCLIRINQAGREGDLSSVSLYYSGCLVAYAKRLLQVVPSTVFKLMSKIAHFQTNVIPELPHRLEKDKLKDYAQLDARYQVAKLTNEVAVFSSGLANMESTLLGIVRIEPKQLLEEGICKELNLHIFNALSLNIAFPLKTKGSEVINKLSQLGNIIDGHQKSFEYIQDYLNINGTKIWQDELRCVIDNSVKEECNRIRQSTSHSKLMEDQPQNISFMGRLVRQIILVTDPKTTYFLESESAWYDFKSKQKVIDIKFFSMIVRAIGIAGLVGVDRILSFMIVKILQTLVEFLTKEALNNKAWSETFTSIAQSLKPFNKTVDNPSKLYVGFSSRVYRLTANFGDSLVPIGQLQLLKKQISFTLNMTAKSKARLYTSALSALNDALVEEFKNNANFEMDSDELSQLANMLDWVGLSNPYNKIYITSHPIPYLPLLLFLFTSTYVIKFQYDKNMDCLQCKKTGETVFAVSIGMSTLLKQFHPSFSKDYVQYCCQFVKSHMMSAVQNKNQDSPLEAQAMLQYLEEFADYSGLGRKEILAHIPAPILDLFRQGYGSFLEK